MSTTRRCRRSCGDRSGIPAALHAFAIEVLSESAPEAASLRTARPGVDQPGLDAVGYMGGTGLEPVSPSVSKAGQRSAPVRHTHVLVDEAELDYAGLLA